MQIKSKLIILTFFLVFFCLNISAEEFNITAKEISIDKDNEILTATGNVKAIDSQGRVINAEKIIYEKNNEFLVAEGNVTIFDTDNNILRTNKATYDKNNEIIITQELTELIIENEYELKSKNIAYNIKKKILSSNGSTIFKDSDKNLIETEMFQYDIENNLFSSIGKIKIIDKNNNKYFFKELHVDTMKKEIIGTNVSVILDQETFGVSKESDPRFVSNGIFISKNKSELSKGVFTICKERDGKCPPWSIKAKKITHDRIKKTIYYEHATLKVYDLPIFYFPRFFHPDPSVKRQSGFLAPFFTNSTSVGGGFGLPYFWAINNDKDLTFTPKVYGEENILFLNEYRQAFRNGFITLDTSYTEGYKNTSATKTSGSRNHIFANLDFNLSNDESYESNLSFKVQKTSNNTYFRIHDIDTALVESENTTLKNEIKYSYNTDDSYLDISTTVYENLREKNNSDKYEYILPNILYGKTFFTEKFGTFDLKSNSFYTNYQTNKHETFLTNDVIWSPKSYISKNGFASSIMGMIRNTNYEAIKTTDYKDEGLVNEINGVIAYKTSLPMKKYDNNFTKLFSPNFMLRYAPGHVKNLSNKDISLEYTNLYALNKTSEVESGLSAVLGFDYKVNKKNNDEEKFSISLGQVFNYEENDDLPSKSSLDQKSSDIVGEMRYNFEHIGQIDYKYSLDHNLSDLNYNEVLTKLNFGAVQFNIDYLEQQNHAGLEHYASAGISLNFSESNKLTFKTKKNFKTESTELYDLSYQYAIDCLTAGLVYRREFYEDVDDLKPKNSLMFTLTFVPLTKVKAPVVSK